MQNSSQTQEGGLARAGSTASGQQSADIPLKPEDALGRSTGQADPRQRIQPVSERFPALERQEIILTFSALDAQKVTVAGDFNGWNPDAAPLEKTGDSDWALRLMLRSGQYEYRFVVDGQWCEDPEAAGRAASPYGGFNSVLIVPLAVRTSLL